MFLDRKISRMKSIINSICIKARYKRHCCFSILGNDILHLKLRMSKEGILILDGGLSVRENVIFQISASGRLHIGKDVFVNDNSAINSRNEIYIGDNTAIGQNVLIYDHDHNYRDIRHMRDQFIVGTVRIGKNVWIGSNVIILKNSVIGDNSVIGAGSLVNGIVPENSIFYNKRLTECRIIERGEHSCQEVEN
jgi:acetyltransferase-like isoleucine patch superfamily enzyme